jgi:hypothetical protein
MPQRKILNSAERDAFESPPVFDSSERKRFFYLPLTAQDIVEKLRTPTNKVCFILTFGYFRAVQKFFPGQFYPKDIQFVAKRLGLSVTKISPKSYDRATFSRHQRLILEFFGVRAYDQQASER